MGFRLAWTSLRPSSLLILIFFSGIGLISWNIYEISGIRNDMIEAIWNLQGQYHEQSQYLRGGGSGQLQKEESKKLIAWINGHGKNVEKGYMKHIFEVFRMLGYKVITGEQPPEVKWDIMWVHDYPFNREEYKYHILNSTENQIVNHIFGSGYYTSKVSLATANLSEGIPQAFQLPREKDQFIQYAEDHPDVMWVQKNNNHRNIKIKRVDELDLEQKDSFIQKFVDNPLLIDNRKFDIGIYTIVTSVLPLRVYILDEMLLRFCPHDYHPFDEKDVDKYVVGDDYTPVWEIESLKDYFVKGKLSFKDSLSAYLTKIEQDPSKIWDQIQQIIAEVFYKQQPKMLTALEKSGVKAKLFELSRFDFVVDDEYKVYLMEANMSPNLSSGHFKQNKRLYEQVLFNILSVAGIASQLAMDARAGIWNRPGLDNPLVSDRDLTYHNQVCFDGTCTQCDAKVECSLCGHCQSEDTREWLRSTVREHLERRQMLRISFKQYEPRTREDLLLSLWLEAKSEKDNSWK